MTAFWVLYLIKKFYRSGFCWANNVGLLFVSISGIGHKKQKLFIIEIVCVRLYVLQKRSLLEDSFQHWLQIVSVKK